MTACDLTKLDAMHMRELLYANSIRSLFIDETNKEVYKRLDINEDGTLVFGKTNIKFINRLFNAEKEISFIEFSIRIAVDLCGRLKNNDRISKSDRESILKDLTSEVIRENCINNKFGVVIDRLLDAARFGIPTELSSRNRSNYSGNGNNENKPPKEQKVIIKHGTQEITLPGSGEGIGIIETTLYKR